MMDYGNLEGPYHRFYLFENSISYHDALYSACNQKTNLLFIAPDDLVRYFSDFMLWIPSKFMLKNEIYQSYGLDYEGWSVIDMQGKEQAINIIQSLTILFNYAPIKLTLRGFYSHQDNDYMKLLLDKEAMLFFLNNLLDMFQKIDENTYAFHLGV